MLPIVIAGLAALAVVVIAIGIAMSAGGGSVASRLERYASAGGGASDEGGDRESAVVAGLSRVIERQDLATRLSVDLARADLKMRPAEFLILWAVTPVIFLAIAFVLGFIFPGFQNIVALVGAVLIGLYAPRFYLKRRQAKRIAAFGSSCPTPSRSWRTPSARDHPSSRASSSSPVRRGRPSARSSIASSETCSSDWRCSRH